MNDLDSNKDNEVDFNEFVVLVAALTVACNDFFQEQQKKKGKWNGCMKVPAHVMLYDALKPFVMNQTTCPYDSRLLSILGLYQKKTDH